MHHLSDTPETAVPYWLNKIADARDVDFAADGVWGFLRNFSQSLPPEPNWSFPGLARAWNHDRQRFGQAGFGSVVINPANFIQYQPPTAKYDGDNPRSESPVSASLTVMDWVAGQAPEATFFIYEGWADLASITSYPPDAAGMTKYLEANTGQYHDWYVQYLDDLKQARPNRDIELIPVASVLSGLLSQPALSDLVGTDLYADDAPHGTPTLYFLAALIAYNPIFGDQLPDTMDLPNTIHPVVRKAYPQIVAYLGQSRTASIRPRISPTRTIARPTIPAMAMGLNGISDWSTQYPFLDLMKSARPWVGHKPGEWGGMDANQMRADGHLSPSGWPLRMPPGIEKIETFVLTELPPQAQTFAGRYQLTYEGTGTVQLFGRATEIQSQPGEIQFSFTPGEGLVAISISQIDESDPIRNIRVLHTRHLALDTLGAQFNPDWLALVQDFRVLRFMDWMQTNGSLIETWDERPQPSDYTYAWRGTPIETMVDLANLVGADPWFNMPHLAEDAYVTAFATQVKTELRPDLKAYVEYSNEVWNFIFPQAIWAGEQAEERWPRGSDDRWMQFAGMRAAQVADLWTDVYAEEAPARLTRVVATHTGWPGLEEPMLNAPLWQKENRANKAPAESFDAYAVTGYFGHEMGGDSFAPQILDWLKISESEALKRSYKALKAGPVRELIEELFPHHAAAAARHDLDLIMYEGGAHITGTGAWQNDKTLTAFYQTFNYSQEVAALYSDVIDGWQKAGGTLFNAFVDVAKPSQWGSWGAKRHLKDSNPRWSTLRTYNATLPATWEARDQAVFANGLSLIGTSQDDLVEGSPHADFLDGGPGDDWLVTAGGSDAVHGGDGVDTAIFPGEASAYRFTWMGPFLMAEGPLGESRMLSIERLEFEADPGQLYAVTPQG
ncbi:MAG: calcium-binding protein [Thalassovita sp.]